MINTFIYIIAIIAMIWVIYEVWFVNKKKSVVEKVIWTIFAIVFSIITAILYYFIGKK